jgi:hypothetical protein
LRRKRALIVLAASLGFSVLLVVILLAHFLSHYEDPYVVHESQFGNWRIQVVRQDNPIDVSTLCFQVSLDNSVIEGPYFLGPVWKQTEFRTTNLPVSGIMFVVEAGHPLVIVAAYDTRRRIVWPNPRLPIDRLAEVESALREAIKTETSQAYEFGDLFATSE